MPTGLHRGDVALELGCHVLVEDAAQLSPHPWIRVDALVESAVFAGERA
jgi:hypothetical protein